MDSITIVDRKKKKLGILQRENAILDIDYEIRKINLEEAIIDLQDEIEELELNGKPSYVG